MTTPKTANLIDIPVADLHTRPEFQARTTEGSAQVVQENIASIRDDYQESKFDPLVVARRPEGGYYIIGGHHRAEGIRQRIAAGKHHTDTVPARVADGDVNNPEDLEQLKDLARFTNVSVAGQSPRELLRTIRPLIDSSKSDNANIEKIAKEVRVLGPTGTARRRSAKMFYDLAGVPESTVERVTDESALPVLSVIGEAQRKYDLPDTTVVALVDKYILPRDDVDGKAFQYPNVSELRTQFRKAAATRETAAATADFGSFAGEGFGADPFLAADVQVLKEAQAVTSEQRRLREQLAACRRLAKSRPDVIDIAKLDALEASETSGQTNKPIGVDALGDNAALAVIAWQQGRGPKPNFGDAILRQVAPEMYETPKADAPTPTPATEPDEPAPYTQTGPDLFGPAPEPEPTPTPTPTFAPEPKPPPSMFETQPRHDTEAAGKVAVAPGLSLMAKERPDKPVPTPSGLALMPGMGLISPDKPPKNVKPYQPRGRKAGKAPACSLIGRELQSCATGKSSAVIFDTTTQPRLAGLTDNGDQLVLVIPARAAKPSKRRKVKGTRKANGKAWGGAPI